MPFRYRLQAVLRLRQSLERQEEQKLLAAASVVAKLRGKLEQLVESQMEARRAEFAQLEHGGAAAQLQYASVCDAAYVRVRKRLRLELQDAEHKRMELLAAYQTARQKRETLEGLRERQQQAYELNAARREQQVADEMFLMRTFAEPHEEILPSGAAESAERLIEAVPANETA